MKSFKLFIATLALSLVSQAHGATNFWANPGPGLWTEPTNWVGSILPTSADVVRINNGGTAVIDSSMNMTNNLTVMASDAATTGTLQMTGGRLTTTSDIRVGGNSTSIAGGTGFFDQLGGTVVMSSGNVNVGIGAIGTYNMGGGSLQMNAASPIFAVGNSGKGTVNQTNGSIYLRNNGNANIGRNTPTGPASSGTYDLSGGTLAAARLLLGNAVGTVTGSSNTFNLSGTGRLITGFINFTNTAASNTFNFTGGTLTVTTNSISLTNLGGILSPGTPDFASPSGTNIQNLVFNPIGTTIFTGQNSYTQATNGTLAIDIAGVSSNDFVDIGASVSNVASATLAGTISVTFLNNFLPALGSTFDILSADTITDTTTVIGNNGSALSSAIVIGGDGRQVLRLTVTAQPTVQPQLTDSKILGSGAFQFSFTNAGSRTFNVFSTTNLSLPSTNWTALGAASEISPGQYQFTDPQATNGGQRFYEVRGP